MNIYPRKGCSAECAREKDISGKVSIEVIIRNRTGQTRTSPCKHKHSHVDTQT